MKSQLTRSTRHRLQALSIASLCLLSAPWAQAADSKSRAPAPADDLGSAAERLNVENIKQKYWARGEESELGVVQNRIYTKARKFELGVFGGIVSTEPFLSVKNLGGLLGYHFNEYVALSVTGYKSFVDPSSALEQIQTPLDQGGLGTTANTNEPKWFLGAEITGSILYGKLSLVGKAIIHYDMHLLGGVGTTATESGRYVTPYLGIGQQIYLTKFMSLRLDYRLMRFHETILEKVRPSTLGTPIGERANYTNTVTLGVNFLIDPFGKKQSAEQQ